MQVNGSPVDLLPDIPPDVWDTARPIVMVVAGALAFIVGLVLLRKLYRGLAAAGRHLAVYVKGRASSTTVKASAVETALTFVVAGIATGVSAQGMWRFTGDVLHFDGPLRVLLFAFIEFGIVISAVRARRSMRENYSAGIDGIAVWVLACLTAVFSALDAATFPEAVFRLAAPLVAAWLWERGMALERRRLRGMSGINWRLTPERILVRVGLAEATDRTASEVDAHRRIKRVALTAKRVHQLREANAKPKALAKAIAKRDVALDQAVEHTDLARNPVMQTALLDMVSTLGGAETLTSLLGEAQAPWELLDHPAVTGAAKERDAVVLAERMREWTDAIKSQRDPEVSAAIQSMAAFISKQHVSAVGSTVSVPPMPAALGEAQTDHAVSSRSGSSWLAPFNPQTRVSGEGAGAGLDGLFFHTDPHTDLHTSEPVGSEQDREDDGEDTDDRGRPNDQDNRLAEEWIRARCRGRNGEGRRPRWSEVQNKYGFSEGWAGNRVRAVQERMSAQGYVFHDDGTVTAPSKSHTDPLTAVNGSADVPFSDAD